MAARGHITEDPNRRETREKGFYEELESFTDFRAVSDLSCYTPAPDDWYVIVADIQGSTDAITQGRYKDVNMVGAACITAVLNATRAHETPFVFGGDGATMMTAPDTMPRVRQALLRTRDLEFAAYGLVLRVGAVPVSRLRDAGLDVLVAKFQLSPGNHMAMFTGGGVGMADKLIKEDDGTQGYMFSQEPADEAPSLDGLSCRWEPLGAECGIMLCMLMRAQSDDRAEAAKTYRIVLDGLNETLDRNQQKNRPVKPGNMRFRWPPRGLRAEALASHGAKNYWRRLPHLYWESLIQWVMNRFDLKAGSFNAPVYRVELRENSDYRRFDDTLRILLDCTPDEVAALEAMLAGFRAQGLINYGLHRADSALMTCLVFSLTDSEHVHFIDGGDGGFAMAARQLKKQIAED